MAFVPTPVLSRQQMTPCFVCAQCGGQGSSAASEEHASDCPVAQHGPLRLNLGCSDSHLKGFTNVDLCAPADVVADLARPWPWHDSTAAEVKAWDIFEHLPSKLDTMNECHRVMKNGAKLDLFVPTTDGRGAFQDPTHVSFWTPNDLFYFCEEFAEWQRFHVSYGITARFRVIEQSHMEFPGRVWKLRAILEAVK